MVSVAEQIQTGGGIYTVAEAAMYARIAPVTLHRWLFGNTMGERVIEPELAATTEKLVTFQDFVQALAIHDIRSQHRVPLPKIREAVNRAKNEYGVEHPFARKHTTYLFEHELFIRVEAPDRLIQLSGKAVDQTALKPIVEVFMKDINFDAEGIANRYRAYLWKNYEIVMNPRHRFGEPIVTSCGYTALALWEACRAEGSLERAADAYGVNVDEAEAAYRYFDHLDGRMAA